jgi:hypothetical protein
MMGGVQYGMVPYRIVQHGPRNPIFLRILEPKIVFQRIQDQDFSDPPISQNQNSEGKEAHRTTSKLTVFLCFQLVFTVSALSLLEYFWWV